MRKLVTVISIICVLMVTGVVLVLTGVIDISSAFRKEEEQTVGESVVWIKYLDSCVLLDSDGNVTATRAQQPEDLMMISGIDVVQMVLGSRIKVDNEAGLKYALLIEKNLKDVGISDKGEIYIASDNTATVYLNGIKILFGEEEGIAKKIEDLKKFYKELQGLSGTLDMKVVDKKNMGYTFKKNDE